jgi:hypothetical protein
MVALLLSAAAAGLQQRMIHDDDSSVEAVTRFAPGRRVGISVGSWPPELRRLLVADILIRFCEQIP